MNWFKRGRTRYILRRYAIDYALWHEITEKLAIYRGLTAVEKAHLREIATLFLHTKSLTGVQGCELSEPMRIVIAALACLPILGLGFGCLSGWSEVVIYPETFQVCREVKDHAGVVHPERQPLLGESWSRGPLILSWEAIEKNMNKHHCDHNVVVHEIAHKLDMLNGPADGYPPLHAGMSIKTWSSEFSRAYALLQRRIERHYPSGIDPYAATSPAEFFAVISEYFFCAPAIVRKEFGAVYEQLCQYYRQNPLLRQGAFT